MEQEFEEEHNEDDEKEIGEHDDNAPEDGHHHNHNESELAHRNHTHAANAAQVSEATPVGGAEDFMSEEEILAQMELEPKLVQFESHHAALEHETPVLA